MLEGCLVRAEDGPAGRVAGVLFDDETWGVVRYLVVDTGGRLPGKKVPFSAEWASGVSPSGGRVEVDLTAEEIRSAPGWEPGTVIDRRYETELHAHYGRTPYWLRRRDGSNG